MTAPAGIELPVVASDGHSWMLQACRPPAPRATVLWLPALGIAARHYLPLAQALSAHGYAVYVHEWRGNGSSDRRAQRGSDWGYRELLAVDLPASEAAIRAEHGALPRVIGGHSLGGQVAALRLALAPNAAGRLWLVGSGSPFWRVYRAPLRFGLPLAYHGIVLLSRLHGVFPGRRIRFAGTEARQLMLDWAASALSGRYSARGIGQDLEAGLRALEVPVRAAVLARDWMAPEESLRFLLGKLPRATIEHRTFDAAELGTEADHFAWMRSPGAIAAWLGAVADAPHSPP